uniref:Calponin-homology (CH) domain-containing protein n=1 Tax=Labrus bergylta TaxID=56723 RepID=A0A3Q3FWF0_9LABR
SWKNGLALCALIHRQRPDLIDFDSLNEKDMAKNNQLAFDVAEQEFGIQMITTESAKSSLTSLDLIPNFYNETSRTTKDGDGVVQVLDRVDKETNNETGESHLSHTHMELSGQWNSVDHECMVDEDCGDLKYCLYEIKDSKCLPCIPTDMPCTIRCVCVGSVYSQCYPRNRGNCQGQSDCRPDLCCAFQRELLFPVCNPKPQKGEPCLSNPNLLMDMLAWDPEGPSDHCPCADNLQCQPHGRGSFIKEQNVLGLDLHCTIYALQYVYFISLSQ